MHKSVEKLLFCFINREKLFYYHFYQKEGAHMYDNDEMLLNILDDDNFPVESEDDE